MQGQGLKRQIAADRQAHPDRIFIKWWRSEQDYIDFELAAKFLETFDLRMEIAGYELIDQEEMWRTIERRSDGRATRVQKEGKWVVHWDPPKGAEDVERLPEYPYNPETLLKILDAETNYNYVD